MSSDDFVYIHISAIEAMIHMHHQDSAFHKSQIKSNQNHPRTIVCGVLYQCSSRYRAIYMVYSVTACSHNEGIYKHTET